MQFCYEQSLKEFNFARITKKQNYAEKEIWTDHDKKGFELWIVENMNILASGVEESFRIVFYYCGGTFWYPIKP